MSFKEVTALRKSGQLEEATTMARADIERSRDKWSCNALFWCLYDKAKQVTVDELGGIVEEMRSLLEVIGEEEIVVNSLRKLEDRLVPFAVEVKRAYENAKNVQLARESYNTLLELYNNNNLAEQFYNDFGWVIYRAVHADKSNDVAFINEAFEVYFKLNLERPSLLHSLILGEAINIEKADPQQFSFVEFVVQWGLSNLQDDDWKQFVTEENNKLPSRVEKLIFLYFKEISTLPSYEPDEEFLSVLDRAISKWPKDDNLVRDRAMLRHRSGDVDGAIEDYKTAIVLSSGQKDYMWNELAGLVENIDLQIGLLSKALMTQNKEEYSVKIRQKMATLLCQKGLYGNAKYEFDKAQQVYNEQGWRTPYDLYSQARAIPEGTVSADNSTEYKGWSIVADEFMYSSLPSVIMVKVAQRVEMFERPDKKPKRVEKWILINQAGKTINIKPNKFKLQRAEIGSCFDVKMNGNDVAFVSPCSAEGLEWRRNIEGQISVKTNREGKTFGFVSDYYVQSKFVNNIPNGAHTRGVAILQDGRWQVISLAQA